MAARRSAAALHRSARAAARGAAPVPAAPARRAPRRSRDLRGLAPRRMTLDPHSCSPPRRFEDTHREEQRADDKAEIEHHIFEIDDALAKVLEVIGKGEIRQKTREAVAQHA